MDSGEGCNGYQFHLLDPARVGGGGVWYEPHLLTSFGRLQGKRTVNFNCGCVCFTGPSILHREILFTYYRGSFTYTYRWHCSETSLDSLVTGHASSHTRLWPLTLNSANAVHKILLTDSKPNLHKSSMKLHPNLDIKGWYVPHPSMFPVGTKLLAASPSSTSPYAPVCSPWGPDVDSGACRWLEGP